VELVDVPINLSDRLLPFSVNSNKTLLKTFIAAWLVHSQLVAIVKYWEPECSANPDSVCHYWLTKAIDKIQVLDY
jgi:hypothetical protein